MSPKETRFSFSVLSLMLTAVTVLAQENQDLYFSAIQGTASRIQELQLSKSEVDGLNITGPESSYFRLAPAQESSIVETDVKFNLVFQPDKTFQGVAHAVLEAGDGQVSIRLTGLSTTGLEGNHEASLQQVIEALNFSTDPGWSTLANHTESELQGDEVGNYLFRKTADIVEIIPLARFSPPYSLPFGYYLNRAETPLQHQVGILSDSKEYHEHQTLHPKLEGGQSFFDPGNQAFGIYVVSPTHVSYTEDQWNKLIFPDNVEHATRIYPVKGLSGEVNPNEYLVCFEEASNGDYQDYVFLLKNVEVVKPGSN